MKRGDIVLVMGAFLAVACVNPREQALDQELVEARVTIEALKKQLAEKDARIDDLSQSKSELAETVLEIEKSLEMLGAQRPQAAILQEQIEGRISLGTSAREGLQDMVDQLAGIHSDLIRQADEATTKLTAAQRELARADASTKALYEERLQRAERSLKIIADENQRLRKDVLEYQTQLADARQRIDELEKDAVEKEAAMQKTLSDLATATANETREKYVGRHVIASHRSLKDNKYIRRASGASREYNPSCARCGSCAPLDLSTSAEVRLPIPAAADQFKVYTEHPEGSWYRHPVGPNSSELVINDPANFWRYERCLVVGY